jgi:hypothetical protein
MKFGVREICDVVLRAKSRMQVGNKIFYKNEPVIYFDTLKTSSLEGAATQVYAQGGRGNPRLIAWEGERTVTFTMEDALISAEGFMILSGAGLVSASVKKPIYQHVTETIDISDIEFGENADTVLIPLSKKPYLPDDRGENFAYVMFMREGSIVTEPYIPMHGGTEAVAEIEKDDDGDGFADRKVYQITVAGHNCYDAAHGNGENAEEVPYVVGQIDDIRFDSVLVDFYVERQAAAQQIEITPDKFGGNFYLEASTLFRNEAGVDMPAEFIVPNCKVQSNFTFTMASSGDPSSFTFTMDAFPDYTRFDHSKKVLAAIQIIEEESAQDLHRGATPNGVYDVRGVVSGIDPHEDLLSERQNGG